METLLKSQQQLFLTQVTKPYLTRIEMLNKLEKVILKYEEELLESLYLDLGKSRFEAYTTEVGFVLKSIKDAKRKLKSWMKPIKVKTPIYQLFTTSYIVPEPLGSVLIIGPFNYPFQLVFEVLIGAIAAGNTAIIKPSEFTIHTSALMEKMIDEAFEPSWIKVVIGNYEVSQALLALKFDHIFFTGSTIVGQKVYEAAAKNLVPVTLELGGKSPTIVDETANIQVAARRIVFGKFLNAGQTCIAPDYIYVHQSMKDALIQALQETIKAWYSVEKMGSIVNSRHKDRLLKLMDPKKIVFQLDQEEGLYLPPTIMDHVTWDDQVMQEEIFGPILPVLTYESLDDLLSLLLKKEKPLALYVFSENQKNIQKITSTISFGGGAINDTIMQVANPNLPFGGVGNSGFGAYHGKSSFDLFSHHKIMVNHKTFYDPAIAYPPYSKKKEALIRRVIK
jgi:aldehyde dehydrogenase (NAD+)